ncbi:MAG: HD domain-containing protein [Thermoanaerobaculia bacterium]|jgi:predicted hydrolase (HD superfamily)|nr:MAG: HD domain-containing protein [Thermoanaerobaculia bacterium]MBZ0103722.1 HD domain-containing protein [Thermoanaerobaculia bacterium]
MTREEAWGLVEAHVEAAGLRRHMLAVEAAMRFYAARLGEDADSWGLAGLLHDWDWEIHPTLEAHPKAGIARLREAGCPEAVVQAILAHNPAGTGVEAATSMDFALRACDEITGLVSAAALVRPSKDVRDVEVKSIQKRWKEKAFAAGVDRAEVERATEDFSRVAFAGQLALADHIGNVLAAMKEVAAGLELDGRLVRPA